VSFLHNYVKNSNFFYLVAETRIGEAETEAGVGAERLEGPAERQAGSIGGVSAAAYPER